MNELQKTCLVLVFMCCDSFLLQDYIDIDIPIVVYNLHQTEKGLPKELKDRQPRS